MTTTPLYDLLALCPACECVIMIDLRASTVLQHAALLETPQEQLEGHLRRATDLFQAAQARSAVALVLSDPWGLRFFVPQHDGDLCLCLLVGAPVERHHLEALLTGARDLLHRLGGEGDGPSALRISA